MKSVISTSWRSVLLEIKQLNFLFYLVGAKSPISVVKEAGWTPEPVSALWNIDKSVALAGNRTPAVQPVTRRYTH
jgi:hypothetical protein